MNKVSPILITSLAIVVAILAVILYVASRDGAASGTVATATATPSATQTPTATPEPSPSPVVAPDYTSAAAGISFKVPDGFYVTPEALTGKSVRLGNIKDQEPDGVPPKGYQSLSINYSGTATADEESTKKLAGVTVKEISVSGGTVRYYEFPNPGDTSRMVGRAYWSGSAPTFLTMSYSKSDNTEAQKSAEAGELAAMRALIPTLVIK